jgi:antitoxin YefM
MTTLTATKARINLYRLLDQVNETHRPVHIVGKRHSGILIAEEDWRGIEETLYLSSIPNMRKSIIEGLNTPINECCEDIKW